MTDQNTDALRCAESLDSTATHGTLFNSNMKAAAHIRRLVAENEAHRAFMRQALEALSEIMQDAEANHVGGWDTADRLTKARAAITALRQSLGE